MLIYLSDYFSSLLWFDEIAFMQNRNRKIEDEITQGTQTITWLECPWAASMRKFH